MKFSIVTPVYNGEKFITETIESVLSQEGDFEIEYIIVDGGSSDETVKIIKKYEVLLKEKKYPLRCKKMDFLWFSEKDNGMYDAINKGFRHATGDVYAYINADDLYLPGAFFNISQVFKKYPQVQWLKGITDYLLGEQEKITKGTCFLYNQEWVRMGIYGRNAYFIQQDSVFWKSELWKKTGGISEGLRYAGDYYLWLQFAKYSPLYSLNKEVSCFRKTPGQLSENMENYRNEQASFSKERGFLNFEIKLFFWVKRYVSSPLFSRFFVWCYDILFPHRQTEYFELDKNGQPFMKTAKYYTIP